MPRCAPITTIITSMRRTAQAYQVSSRLAVLDPVDTPVVALNDKIDIRPEPWMGIASEEVETKVPSDGDGGWGDLTGVLGF